MRISSTRCVYQGCVLGTMFFAIVASQVHKQLAAIALNESLLGGYSDDGNYLGSHSSLVAMGDAMP
jgi:predicted acyl esterase